MKVGLVTLYRGYNYGTSLQAYALQSYIEKLGYETSIIWKKTGAHAGRDIRPEKLFRMVRRTVLRPTLLMDTLKGYYGNFHNSPNNKIKQKYLKFNGQRLNICGMTNKQLKDFAKADDTLAVVCGSDQIWKANAANVDPIFYLQFVPEHKRVAYAPSFGGTHVPSYNAKIISKYLKSIPNIAVREESGVDIVRKLTGRTVKTVIDPTLLIDWHEFIKSINENYVLLYFLDEPSDKVLDHILKRAKEKNLKIYAIPHKFEKYNKYSDIQLKLIGPQEFPSIIANASCVYTDSFHGTVFSINLNRPFWVFERNYKSFKSQSTRITDLLKVFNLSDQYITKNSNSELTFPRLDFVEVNKILDDQRDISKKYFLNSFENCK